MGLLNSVERFYSRSFLLIEIYEREKGKCYYCNVELIRMRRKRGTSYKINQREFTLDHIIPKCEGGQTTLENCVASCWLCNHRKGNSVGVWKKYNGFEKVTHEKE